MRANSPSLLVTLLLSACQAPNGNFDPPLSDGADANPEPPPTTERYHPAGFATPAVHGLEMKLGLQDCRTCHGAELRGQAQAPGCDTCHQADWRTNCVYCHGGDESTEGAPPRDLDHRRAAISFPSHTRHVTTTLTTSAGCEQCHRQPADVMSLDHAFDSTPAVAEVVFTGGVSPAATYQSGGCANTYCHGDGQTNGAVAASARSLGCDSCHAANDTPSQYLSMSGAHVAHLINPTMDCTSCHEGTTRTDPLRISNPTRHINGRPDVGLSEDSITYDAETGTCAGVCHLFPHPNLPWNVLGAQ